MRTAFFHRVGYPDGWWVGVKIPSPGWDGDLDWDLDWDLERRSGYDEQDGAHF